MLGERTLVMGVLNVTPDSFSDGGRYFSLDAAVERAIEIERAGADILDIGGESTRPGSEGISADEELRRVVPVIERLRGTAENSDFGGYEQIRSGRSGSGSRRRDSE